MNARATAAALRRQLERAGVPDATFEAELVVRQAAGLTRAAFFVDGELDHAALNEIACRSARRLKREPSAYIAGQREFAGLSIAVDPAVLIPRAETELLVDVVLDELGCIPNALVVDVGTGSGCIAAAIGANSGHARIVATDISSEALVVARRNFRAFAPQVVPVRSDLASAIGRCDIVVANLPYIPAAIIPTLEPEVRIWEPRIALDGGGDGMELIRRLIDDCATRLHPRLLALEVMAGQAQKVAAYASDSGAETIQTQLDLGNIERVVTARWA